jgi:hypothetical protein
MMRKAVLLKKILRWSAAAIAAFVILMQLVRVDRSNPAVLADVAAPPPVAEVLRRSCYDCHSNETRWPWYSAVAPVSWMVARDVRLGRESLNFSTWERDEAQGRESMAEILETVLEGEMPMAMYVRLHPDAALTSADVSVLRAWCIGAGAAIRHDEEDDAD